MENLIVREVPGVVEKEVVLDAHVGDDGHGDLYVTAFVGGWDDVEGGNGQAEDGAGDGVDRNIFARSDGGSCEANDGEEHQGVAAHYGGGGVGEPEEGDGDGDGGDGDSLAEDGMEEEWDEGSGEEFGVGGALVSGEEHVRVHRVEN